MDLKTFNLAMLVGWILASIGGIVINIGAGILLSGVMLIALTLFCGYRFGLYDNKKKDDEDDTEGAA